MKWGKWLATWELWSRSEVFRKRFDRAVEIAKNGTAKGDLYASISGGKDSVALLAVLKAAGVDCRAAHAHSSLNLPETYTVAKNTADHFAYPFDVVESPEDPWEVLTSLPGEWADTGRDYQEILERFSAGNLLVQYAYHEGVDGWFDGRRANENKRTRGELFRTRGPLFRSAIDGLWTCCPLAWWTSRDSFAAAVMTKAPIHPFYRCAAEKGGEDPETVRIDLLFGPSIVNSLGRMVPVQRCYPDLWDRLVSIRPEMGTYGE